MKWWGWMIIAIFVLAFIMSLFGPPGDGDDWSAIRYPDADDEKTKERKIMEDMEDYEKFIPNAILRKEYLQLKLKSKDELIKITKKEITEIKEEIEKIDTFLT